MGDDVHSFQYGHIGWYRFTIHNKRGDLVLLLRKINLHATYNEKYITYEEVVFRLGVVMYTHFNLATLGGVDSFSTTTWF